MKTDERFSLNEFIEYVNQNFPEYVLVKTDDYESSDKETYKFLYEKACSELNRCKKELLMAQTDIQNLERDYAELSSSLENEKLINGSLNSESKFIEFIDKYLHGDVLVTGVSVRDSDGSRIETAVHHISDAESLSDQPGVYGFKRPSWFSPVQKALNRKTVLKKNVNHTKELLRNRLRFLKKIIASDDMQKAANEVDSERKKNIAKILLGPGSNEEKYLKYILNTPGLSKEFQDILFHAADIGIDANVVIELLEQPKESFNKEIIEAYVSEIHKGTEYNLKQELANELVCGEWYISASINGTEQKLQLVPFEEIRDIENKLKTISNIFSQKENRKKVGADVSVDMPETSAHEIQDEERFPYIYDDNTFESSSIINFDDSMI